MTVAYSLYDHLHYWPLFIVAMIISVGCIFGGAYALLKWK